MFAPLVKAPKASSASKETPQANPLRESKPVPRQKHETGLTRVADQQPVRDSAWDFTKAPVFPADRRAARASLPLPLQRKLAVGTVNDPLEHEADRVAEEVVSELTPEIPVGGRSVGVHPRAKRVQTPLAIRSSSELAQLKADEVAEPEQTRPDADGGAAPVAVHDVLRSPGRPLETEARGYFEPRFGYDFSRVRVHSDSGARAAALSIGARAFASGHHIIFGDPTSAGDRRLLAHELAHVVQQAGTRDGVTSPVPRPGGALPTIARKPMPDAPMSLGPVQPKTPPTTERTPSTIAGSPSVDQVWSSLDDFVVRAAPLLANVEGKVEEFLARYDSAYEAFTSQLAKSEQDAAEAAKSDKWKSVLTGLIVGTGVGLAAGELLVAAVGIRAIVNEMAGEAVEAGAAVVLDPPASTVDFKPPPEAAADKVARDHWMELARAWKALAVVEAAGYAFSRRQNALRDAAQEESAGKRAPSKGKTAVTQSLRRDLQRLADGIAGAERALGLFLAAVDTPILSRTERGIERDLWIRWMSRGEGNAGALAKDDNLGKRMRELGVVRQLAGGGEHFDLDPQ